MSRFEIEKDWRVSVLALAFILSWITVLSFIHPTLRSLLDGTPFYFLYGVGALFLLGVWVSSRLRVK